MAKGSDDDNDDLFGSESENEKSAQDKELEDNLEDDIDDVAPRQRQRSPADGSGSDGETYRKDIPLGPPMEAEAHLLPLPPSNSLFLLRTSNIVGIQTKPFDPVTFEKEEESYIDDSSGQRRVKLRDHGVIRWRVRKHSDGTEEPESNARFVKWSDGSWQLLLGDEALDVTRQDITDNNMYLYNLSKIIQGQAALRTKLALRPASLDSGLHRRLRDAVDKRQGRVARVGMYTTMVDPEMEKGQVEKQVEAVNKGKEKLEHAQERVMERYTSNYRASAGAGVGARHLSEGFLEEADLDEEEEGGRGGRGRGGAYDEKAEAEGARRLQSAKRAPPTRASAKRRRGRNESEDDELSLPEDDVDEEDEDFGAEASDDSDGDDADGDDDEEIEDDETDRKKREKKKQKTSGGTGGGKKGGALAGSKRGGATVPVKGAPRPQSLTPPPRQATPPVASKPGMIARRGVVLSDDEDD